MKTNGVPKIRFKGFTDDWEQRKLGDCCEQIKETVDPQQNPDVKYWEYSMPAFDNGNKPDLVYGSGMNSIRKVINTSCLLINKLNVRKKRIWLVETPLNNSVCSAEFVPIVSENVDLRFIKYIVSENKFTRYLEDCSSGSSNSQKRVTPDVIMSAVIKVPTIAEQQKVGEYFSDLDHFITLHQRKCEQTKELKKFMLQKMFPKKGEKNPEIRFPGFTDDWEQRKLGEVANYRNGKAHENDIDDAGDYIVINSKFVSTDGEVKKYSNVQNEPLYEGEIAFVLSDVPNGRAIARTFLVDKSGKYTLNQRIAGITPHENTDAYYLHIKLNRNAYFLKFDDGNKQTNLSIKDVLNHEDYYPCYEEQKKIGDYFKSLDHLITLHQRKCEQLKELKKFMLQNMFPKKG